VASPTIFLILSIISSTGIFLIFRLIEKRGIRTFPVIVINYIIAASLGLILSTGTSATKGSFPPQYSGLAILIGFLFIVMFFVVGRSSQKAGMSVTTVAGKMSVIFPITFSLLYDPADSFSSLKLAGILVAIPGVLMTVIRKQQGLRNSSFIYLPLLLFIGMGVVDSLIKLAQFRYISEDNLSLFTAILFSISALIGILVSLFRKHDRLLLFNKAVLFWGICLGAVNFGSIYFLIRALNYKDMAKGSLDSSVIFGINNIGIVSFSVLLGLILFREKLSPLNVAGILTCILATLLLAYSV
jgi:drug/metabolite transporter (DMT)-like permease